MKLPDTQTQMNVHYLVYFWKFKTFKFRSMPSGPELLVLLKFHVAHSKSCRSNVQVLKLALGVSSLDVLD